MLSMSGGERASTSVDKRAKFFTKGQLYSDKCPMVWKSSAPKIDLEKAGLKLVETKKSDKGIQDKKETAKTKARKKADWQKDKVEAKSTGKLEMVETKKKTTSKPKKTAKKG